VLDRVFVSREWEQKFPKVEVSTLTRVGSDHCPLLMDHETTIHQPKRGFRFEAAWLSQQDFKKHLTKKWPQRKDEGVQDFWKRMKKELRQLS
jgi:hypothetical protein